MQLKLICPSDDAHQARLVEAETGRPYEVPGGAVVDVHHLTPERPWLEPPEHDLTAGGQVVRVRKPGVPAPALTRCLLHLGSGVVEVALEVAAGVGPFRWHNVRLSEGV